MRSSLRVFDSKTGEMIGRVMRTGEEEISKLSFSHNEAVQLRSEVPQTAGNYRVECWVGEEGGEFEAMIVDAFDVQGVYGHPLTVYDLSDYPDLIDGCPVCLYDNDGVLADVVGKYSLATHSVSFLGHNEDRFPCLVYTIMGNKGFMSIPVVGDVVTVQQETGDREITVRYFEEGEDV